MGRNGGAGWPRQLWHDKPVSLLGPAADRYTIEVCETPGEHRFPMEELQAAREALAAAIDQLLKGTG